MAELFWAILLLSMQSGRDKNNMAMRHCRNITPVELLGLSGSFISVTS